MALSVPKVQELELRSVIGFAGHVPGGLILHPDEQRLIYPLGSTLIVKRLLKSEQKFLIGHGFPISCVCMNKEGTLLASGEKTHMGFPAQVIVWDLETMQIKYRLDLHKGSVQSLSYSNNNEYLVTLGGEDDNKLVCWDLKTGQAICGSTAANDSAKVVVFYNNDNEQLVTAGKYHIRTWQIDRKNRKLRSVECRLGQIKRIINTVTIDINDLNIYAGTQSGDVLCISARSKLFKGIGPIKKPFSCGIQTIIRTKPDEQGQDQLLVGSGSGVVALMDVQRLKVVRKLKLDGKIKSLCLNEVGDHFFVGTDKGNIYCVALCDFEYELRRSAHCNKINCVAFPAGFSQLFVTGSQNDLRVWNLQTTQELLRIQIPNVECLCVVVSYDGKQIISGWSDGKIRAFLPQTGRLLYAINDAHSGNVNCISILKNGVRVVSGGFDGRVRVWDCTIESQNLVTSWKEHKCPVTCLELNDDETSMISSAGDGSCIVWDLVNFNRVAALFAQNQFTHVLYHPDQSQILTTGTDRKISWWDATEADTIRIVDGSDSAAINSLAITPNGNCFVSAGADELVNLWKYDEGVVSHVGHGHSGGITSVTISPDISHIVSVGEEGGIFIWKYPEVEIETEI